MSNSFPAWFETTRKKKNLSQIQAAKQLRLSSPTVSRWENGTEPRAKHLPRIVKWAPITAEALLKLFE